MQVKCVEKSPSSLAWCVVPGQTAPHRHDNYSLLALGKQQALDDSFESASHLEIVDTSLSHSGVNKMPTVGMVSSQSCFTKINWGVQSAQSDTSPLGLIAGGMDDGTVTIWNPYAVMKSDKKNALIHQSRNHERAVSDVQWNPKNPKYLASAACDAQLFVWDMTDPSKPVASRPPTGQRQQTSNSAYGAPQPPSLSAISWNDNVPYILAACNVNGETQIYDLKTKKIALNFRTRTPAAVTGVAWNPSYARQLAVCYANNTAEIWDLRQPMSPKYYLENGHTSRILSLAWCQHDSNILITSGEDNLGVVWNGNTGRRLHHFEFESGPNFDIEWSPLRAGQLATSSSDGKVSIYNVNYVGDHHCPSWLGRHSGASFGFGGKVASFGVHTSDASRLNTDGRKKKSKKAQLPPSINVEYLSTDPAMVSRAHSFQRILSQLCQSSETLHQFAQEKAQRTDESNEEKSNLEENDNIWELINIFYFDDCKDRILSYLGYAEDLPSSAADLSAATGGANGVLGLGGANVSGMDDSDSDSDGTSHIDDILSQTMSVPGGDGLPNSQGVPPPPAQQPSEEETEMSDDEDFFSQLANSKETTPVPNEGDDDEKAEPPKQSPPPSQSLPSVPQTQGESESGATKKQSSDDAPKTAEKSEKAKPRRKSREMSRYDEPTKVDDAVKAALVVGDYQLAVNLSLKAGNMADALLFAYQGGDELWSIASRAYFTAHRQKFISRVFRHIVDSQWETLVRTSDLMRWKETLSILITFTKDDEFEALVNGLAKRLVAEVNNIEGAIACYLCSNNVNQLIELWTIDTASRRRASVTSESQHKSSDLILHECIEKVLVFINAPFKTARGDDTNALSNIFSKYASLLANQASLSTAAEFLRFITNPSNRAKFGGAGANSAANNEITQLLQRIAESDPYLNLVVAPPQPVHTAPSSTGGTRPRRDRRQIQPKRKYSNTPPHPSPNVTNPRPPPIGERTPHMTPVNRPNRLSHGPPPGTPTDSRLPPAHSHPHPGAAPVTRPSRPTRVQRRNPSGSGGPPPSTGSGAVTAPPSIGRTRPGPVAGGGPAMNHRRPGGPPVNTTGAASPAMRPQPVGSVPSAVDRPPSQPVPNRRPMGRQMPDRPSVPTSNATQPVPSSMPVRPSSSGAVPSRPMGRGRGRGRGRGGAPSRPVTTAGRGGPPRAGMGAGRAPADPRRPGAGGPAPTHPRNPTPSQTTAAAPAPHSRPVGRRPVSATPPSRRGGRGTAAGPPRGHPSQPHPNSGMPARPNHSRPHHTQPPVEADGYGGGGGTEANMEPEMAERTASSSSLVNSAGTGFYGETKLKKPGVENDTPLPPNAAQVVDSIHNYVQQLHQLQLNHSEKRTLNSSKQKFEHLRTLIGTNKISYNAYTQLLEMNEALQSRQYDLSLKTIQKFAADADEFKVNRQWLTSFRTIVNLARKYSI